MLWPGPFPFPGNPFTDCLLKLTVTAPDGREFQIDGFCDAVDGSVFAVRYLPMTAGRHHLAFEFRTLDEVQTWRDDLAVADHGASGIVQAREEQFVYSASGDPFLWNSTTTYLLPGLAPPLAIKALDRLADHGINRIRVSLTATRQADGGRWFEPQVKERSDFTFRYGPWPDANPDSVTEPQWDLARFNVDYWHRFEAILAHAQHRGIQVQVIFYTDAQEPQNYPFDRSLIGDDSDELRYFDTAVARLAAFANVEWCITNEWALYRPDAWVEVMGQRLALKDPYGHLLSVHGHGHFPFLASPWSTHALYQVWDEHGGYDWTQARRRDQEALGVTKPIVNEEFGYEDHYAGPWGESRRPPARNVETRARLAWEIAMAGGWCTTGESAASGLGGWINGLNEGDSTLFRRHQYLQMFLARIDLARAHPEAGRVSGHAYCRSIPGELYAVYLYGGGTTVLKLDTPGRWDVTEFDPATGMWTPLVSAQALVRDASAGPGWVSPFVPFGDTRAYLIQAVNP